MLFQEGLGSAQLTQCLFEGWKIKKTTLSDEFTHEKFQQMYGQATKLLFLIDAKRNLRVNSADEKLSPQSGDTLIASSRYPMCDETQDRFANP